MQLSAYITLCIGAPNITTDCPGAHLCPDPGLVPGLLWSSKTCPDVVRNANRTHTTESYYELLWENIIFTLWKPDILTGVHSLFRSTIPTKKSNPLIEYTFKLWFTSLWCCSWIKVICNIWVSLLQKYLQCIQRELKEMYERSWKGEMRSHPSLSHTDILGTLVAEKAQHTAPLKKM